MRPGIGRMSGMRANETRSATASARLPVLLLLTAIGSALLSHTCPGVYPQREPGGACLHVCKRPSQTNVHCYQKKKKEYDKKSNRHCLRKRLLQRPYTY